MSEWPFDDPENVATITVWQVTDSAQPILRVTHDAEDGMWQFLTGAPANMADVLLVGLSEVYRIDPSIGELADLPLGWIAERAAPGLPWNRSRL